MSVPYMISTPIWGYLVDSWVQPEYISPIGNILIATSLLLIGPIQYLSIPPSYALTEGGLALLGIGTAATLTATFALTQKHAVRRLPDLDEDGSSVISSLWTSAFALGNFLGPTVGGPLVDWLNFAGSTPILQIWALVMLITDILVLFWLTRNPLVTRRKGPTRELYTRIEWPKLHWALNTYFWINISLKFSCLISNIHICPYFFNTWFVPKGIDRLCKVVKLSMQRVVDKFFRIHFRHIKRFHDV